MSKEDQQEETSAIDDLLSFQNSEQLPSQTNQNFDVLSTIVVDNTQSNNFEEDDEEFDIFAESEKKTH